MKKVLYVLFVIAVSFTSCKKKEEDKTTFPPASDAVVKSMVQTPSGLSETYSYDGQGRVVDIQRENGSHTTVTYASDTVTETNYSDSGSVVSLKVLFLNSSGLAINSYITDTLGNISSFSSYTYDGDNIKIDERTSDNLNNEFAHKMWNIIDKNVYYHTSTDLVTPVNNLELGFSYSYEEENTTGNQNKGMKYYGNSSANIVKSQSKSSSVSGGAYYTFQYTFDGSGRVAIQTAYNHQSEVVYVNTYTYN